MPVLVCKRYGFRPPRMLGNCIDNSRWIQRYWTQQGTTRALPESRCRQPRSIRQRCAGRRKSNSNHSPTPDSSPRSSNWPDSRDRAPAFAFQHQQDQVPGMRPSWSEILLVAQIATMTSGTGHMRKRCRRQPGAPRLCRCSDRKQGHASRISKAQAHGVDV